MNYKKTIKKEMEKLAKQKEVVFIGYNLRFGSRIYGTLENVPKRKCLEMPVAENLMSGIAIGMALGGYKPVLIFERHDFMLNAMDSLVNHLDKIELMSNGQYVPIVLIRAIVGNDKPIDPGPQHVQDFTKAFKEMLTFPVYDLKNTEDVKDRYKEAREFNQSMMLVERKELYNSGK